MAKEISSYEDREGLLLEGANEGKVKPKFIFLNEAFRGAHTLIHVVKKKKRKNETQL
jgi:hypothetical protein